MFTLSLRYHKAHEELKMVSNQHTVNTKISRTHASTKWTVRNTFQWQFDNNKTFVHENVHVVCKISSILLRPQCIDIQSWTWKHGNMCPQLGNTWRQISLLVYEHRQRVKIPKTSMKGRYSHMKQYIYIVLLSFDISWVVYNMILNTIQKEES